MKTRIKIIEYQNGRKEYLCQQDDLDTGVGLLILCICVPLIWWKIPKAISMFWLTFKTCDSMDDAKIYIDTKIKNENETKEELRIQELDKKVKNFKIIKYP